MKAPVVSALVLAAMIAHTAAHAGVFGEHKRIGDEGFSAFMYSGADRGIVSFFRDTLGMCLDRRANRIDVFSRRLVGIMKTPITYGDLTGLSADHGVNPVDVFGGLLSANSKLARSLNIHLDAINAGRNSADDLHLELIDPAYMIKAIIDKSHFYRYGFATFERHLEQFRYADLVALNDDLYTNLEDVFSSLRESNAIAKYALLHAFALQMAHNAGVLIGDTSHPYNLIDGVTAFETGLLFNAFADHFLQDAFSSGHLAVRRSSWTFLDDKGRHDFYGRVGVPVTNLRGDRWTEYGDNNMDSVSLALAAHACRSSLDDFWSAYHGSRSGIRSNGIMDTLGQSANDAPATARYLAARFAPMFRWFPLPLQKEAGEPAIRFGNSRGGLIIGLAYAHNLRNERVPRSLVAARIGLGYTIATESNPLQTSRETAAWAAISIMYLAGWQNGERTGEVLATGDYLVYDMFFLSAGIGRREGYTVWVPGIGMEFKPAQWDAGIGVEVQPVLSRYAPAVRVLVELRYY